MEAILNKTQLTDAHEVLKHVSGKRSSPTARQVLVRSEPGRISLIATNEDIDVRYQSTAKENANGGEFLVPLSTIAGSAKHVSTLRLHPCTCLRAVVQFRQVTVSRGVQYERRTSARRRCRDMREVWAVPGGCGETLRVLRRAQGTTVPAVQGDRACRGEGVSLLQRPDPGLDAELRPGRRGGRAAANRS